MAHDGQDLTMTSPVILPDLLALTGAAVAPVEALLETATARVRETVSVDGKVSGKLIEENQTAAHGLSWLATYAQSLKQMQAWAERLEKDRKFGEIEQIMHQIAFGEYLCQIHGGIPMSQGEITRLHDIGLGQDDMGAMMTDAVVTLTQSGNSQAARTRLVVLMQEQSANITFGASGVGRWSNLRDLIILP